MIRPLDEALIDYEKTYRQTFKEPLYQHEQYTKRQLIYNYAAVGSQFICKTALNQLKSKKSKPKDLEDIINQWNDPLTKVQHISNQPIKIADKTLSPEEDEELRNIKKQVQVLKKQKMIIKNRHQRNIFFRKQIEILFKTKNLNMFSVDSMRSHANELKPCISYNSRNRVQKYQQNRQGDKTSNRQYDQYRQYSGRHEESRQSHRKYDQRQDSRRNDDRESYKKSDHYSRQSQRKDDYRGERERSRHADENRDYRSKRDSNDRSQSFYSTKNTNNYYTPQQYSTQGTPYSSTQFSRNDISYNKYLPTIEISSSHNQNYQPSSYEQSYEQRVIYPPPPQSSKSNSFYQYDSNGSSQYGFRVCSSDSHRHFQDK